MRLEYFEMIDRVAAITAEAKSLDAVSRVPDASTVFEGHFPGHPLVPGVLLTETMAQASGYLILALQQFQAMPFLVGVDQARFRRFVGPGTELDVRASVEHEGSGFVVTKSSIRTTGTLIASAQLRFAIRPFPDGMAHLMTAQARRLGLEI